MVAAIPSSRAKLATGQAGVVEYRYGDYTEVVPPDPIPNSEVKYLKANDSGFVPRK